MCSSSADEATADILDSVGGSVFTLGDNAYENGTLTEFQACYEPSWGRHKSRTYPASGNHEYQTPGASGYFAYYGTIAGDPAEGWYSYDIGSWHVVVLNSECSEVGGCGVGSAQERWLRADLAANPTSCTLAYWHRPRFSSGPAGGYGGVAPLWQALQDFDAEIVLAGHHHAYERFAPQLPNTTRDDVNGIRQFVVGTGGRSLVSFSSAVANSEIRNASTFGVLRLDLRATSYSWEFLPIAGSTFTDAGSTLCH